MLDVKQPATTVNTRDERPGAPLIDQPAADPTLDRAISLGRISGEALAWVAVLFTAILIRLASLGSDALNPDGAHHAYAAYSLFRGSGAALDSSVGGPFAVIFGALLLFLFGISDQVIRLGPALAGIGAVALVLPLRPYLGRAGALLAALLLAISPSVVYFSRAEQPDAYATFFAMLLFVALLRTFDHGRRGDMILVGAAVAFLFVAAPVGPTLLLLFLAATLLIWVRGRATAMTEGESTDTGARSFGAPGLFAATRSGGLIALLVAVAILFLVFSAFGAVPGNLASGPAEWLGAWIVSLTGPG
ncbi:MAG TPA: glycosyltransferase family 39 protein, partial [Thermomicrobiales bacterium]